MGLSWAHVLGDAFTATNFINMWANIMAGHKPSPKSLNVPNSGKSEFPPSISEKLFSVKRVDPVGDHWVTANNCKMETHSFRVTAKGLHQLRSSICGLGQPAKIPPFEILCAIIWKSLAKIRGESWPQTVTVCRKNSLCEENEITTNGQVVGMVEAEFSAAKAELLDLAQLIAEKMVDERSIIEEIMEKDEGKEDFIVYGANLTFVNLEDANIYGLEFKGHKPIFANYSIGGVGDEGVVLVLPWLENGKEEGGSGRILTVTLPENQLAGLKIELKGEWAIV